MATYGGQVKKTSGDDSGTWACPAGTSSIKAAAIGGGGSGYRDTDGDKDGGGGGGGGGSVGNMNFNGNDSVQWKVSKSVSPTNDGANNGEDSWVRKKGGSNIVYAYGGDGGTDDDGGGGGGNGVGNEYTQSGGSGEDDDNGRDGGGAIGCGRSGSNKGGKGANININNSNGAISFSCTGGAGGRSGKSAGGGGAGNKDDGSAGDGARGECGWSYYYAAPTIDSVTVTNQFNTSPPSDHSTSDTVKIQWTSSNTTSVQVRKGGVSYCNDSNGGSGSCNVSTGLTSVAGSNSPATKTYNVVGYGYGGQTVKKEVTVKVKNDNKPNTSGLTKTFTNINPESDNGERKLGKVQDVDIPTWAISDSNCKVGNGNGAWSNKIKLNKGDNLWVKSSVLPYNTDITGRETSNTGNLNTKTFSVTLGTASAMTITYQTKRPVIKEIFNYADNKGNLPNPDIDMLDSPSPSQYLKVTHPDVNEIQFTRQEINNQSPPKSTEIKSNNGDIQIKINSGSWQNVRKI